MDERLIEATKQYAEQRGTLITPRVLALRDAWKDVKMTPDEAIADYYRHLELRIYWSFYRSPR